MGGCIKALFTGLRSEELQSGTSHAPSERRSYGSPGSGHYSTANPLNPTITATTTSQLAKGRKQSTTKQKQGHYTVPLDINSANYHQLCVIARISTGQAETIINYRVHECGGRLHSTEQLLKIHGGGITPDKLQDIGSSMIAGPGLLHITKCQSPKKNQAQPVPKRSNSPIKSPSHMTFNLPSGILLFGEDNSPPPTNKLSVSKNIRIGSWNLECFTSTKASNLGVLEVVCMTILMNG